MKGCQPRRLAAVTCADLAIGDVPGRTRRGVCGGKANGDEEGQVVPAGWAWVLNPDRGRGEAAA